MKTQSIVIGAVVFFICIASTARSQQMYCMTSQGSAYGGGSILSMNGHGNFNLEYAFQPPGGYFPMGNLMQASNGKLYGVCLQGGIYASCTIFCWDTTTKAYSDVYDFDIINGDFPTNTPVEVNGVLFGTGVGGGLYNGGVIYAYDINNNIYSNVYNFPMDSSQSTMPMPYGGLMQHSNGKLYGMTGLGGAYNAGTIYSFDPATYIFSEVYHFEPIYGANPYGTLIEGNNGILYGTAYPGGTYGEGVVFSFDPATGYYVLLHEFNGTEGSAPSGGVMEASDGLLYGMTHRGGAYDAGVIFKLNPSNHDYVVLHELDITHGSMAIDSLMYGVFPAASTLNETNGILYGATTAGGAHNAGVLFSFDSYNLVYTVMLDLDPLTYGAFPSGGLVTVANSGTLSVFITGVTSVCVSPGNSVRLTANVASGIGPFDYLWSNGSTTQSIKEYPVAGINHYFVTVTDQGTLQSLIEAIDVEGIALPPSDVTPTVENATVTLPYDTTGLSNFTVDYGDGSAPGTSLKHTYAENGSYPVSLYAENGCGSNTILKNVTISDIGVFINPSNTFECSIYPNPGNGLFTISVAGVIEPLSLMIYDLSGKMVYHQRAGETDKMQLDLTSLPKGVYTLRLFSGEGSGFRKLVSY